MSAVETGFAAVVLQAWQRQLDFTQLLVHATELEKQGFHPLSAVLYRSWLSRNHTSYDHYAWFNLGVALFNAADFPAAKDAYCKAIELQSDFVQPHFNLGLVYERLGQREAAIEAWRWVEQNVSFEQSEYRAILLSALNNLGRILESTKQFGDALACLDKSLLMDPLQPDVLHHWVFMREKQCLWPVYTQVEGVSEELMCQSTSALAMLSLSDDPQAQLSAARNFVGSKVNSDVVRLAPAGNYGHKRIRVAYCSSDFCLHPVAMLTAELFECHDRDSFEIYGFCWSPEDGSAIRQRVIKSMDHFFRIHELSDEAAAALIREHEIDILVDLQGQTHGARANMLAYRPAPIQITYLGLPATTGLPSIDYVIADKFLIPEDSVGNYSEKPLYMPDVYQVSDRKRLSAPSPSRESCGLPPEGFVFCSFNNNFKYTPEVFDAWMSILLNVPDSVLWLLSDNPWAEANLKKEAVARGVNDSRLVFATRTSPEVYLSRYTVADLFLDTFPFNAGTTASDALWMGLPILTRSGRTFASRMAGALLTAAGLNELITYDIQDYVRKAIALGSNPGECVRLRKELVRVREHGALFDTTRFALNLEDRFKRLVAELS